MCGVYALDGQESERIVTYSGLGDDPAGYRITRSDGRFSVTDDQVGVTRPGRQHRQMVETAIRLPQDAFRNLRDRELERVRQDVQHNAHDYHQHARALKVALAIYAEAAPLQTAAFAFAHGLAGIQHALTIHNLLGGHGGETQAKRTAEQILEEVYDQLDDYDEERAETVLTLLLSDPER